MDILSYSNVMPWFIDPAYLMKMIEISVSVVALLVIAGLVYAGLFNLLSNAVKFTPDRGKVGIRAKKVHQAVQISVWDTGIGIAPEDQQRIFEEFQQVGKGLTGKTEGTGLGLTLSKKFVELHGGTIWVESTPDQGSTFSFTLPIEGMATATR